MDQPRPELASTLILYSLLTCSAVVSGFGDILIFRWAKNGGGSWLSSGLALWIVGLMLVGMVFRYSTLPFSIAVVLLVVIHVLVDVAWDVAFLGTKLTSLQWAGVTLAVLAVLLLQIGRKAA